MAIAFVTELSCLTGVFVVVRLFSLLLRSRSSAKVKVKYQGLIERVFVSDKHILFYHVVMVNLLPDDKILD